MDIASQSALPDGYRLYRFETLDSTNTEALRRVAAGQARHGDVIMSSVQTGGRGRRGRHWTSLPGNLHATIITVLPEKHPAWQLSFLVGLCIHETLLDVAPDRAFSLKWPNDVLCDRKKIAGALLERDGDCCAIGIGINLRDAPCDQEVRYPATSLQSSTSCKTGRTRVLTMLCHSFDRWYRSWQLDGFSPVRTAWLARAHSVGESLSATTADGVITGRYTGLGCDGTLLLVDSNGKRHQIAAGDLEFCGTV